jgi:hypothetical protein
MDHLKEGRIRSAMTDTGAVLDKFAEIDEVAILLIVQVLPRRDVKKRGN